MDKQVDLPLSGWSWNLPQVRATPGSGSGAADRQRARHRRSCELPGRRRYPIPCRPAPSAEAMTAFMTMTAMAIMKRAFFYHTMFLRQGVSHDRSISTDSRISITGGWEIVLARNRRSPSIKARYWFGSSCHRKSPRGVAKITVTSWERAGEAGSRACRDPGYK